MKRQGLILALLAASLAGCLSGADDAPEDAQNGSNDDSSMPLTLYLDASGALVRDVPEAGTRVLDWSWGEWFEGTTAPAWTAPASEQAYVIEQATVTIQYETSQPNVHTDTRPPFTIWFGAGDSIIEHAFAAGPNPWLPGATQTITFEVDSLPHGGLVVLPGTEPILHVGHYYNGGQGQGLVSAVLGGENAARIDWHVRPIDLPATESTSLLDESGDLLGGRCVAPLNIDGSAQADFTIDVPENAVGIDAVLTRADGTGLGPDLDFYFSNLDGEDVAHAAGSASPEAIRLRSVNLDAIGPGTWGVHLYNCQPQTSTYHIQVDVLTPA